MRPTRTTLAAVLATAALLGGCSDDGNEEGAGLAPTSTPNPTEEARTACDAEVEVTGKLERTWAGEGFVITENQSGPVLYRAADGKVQLTVFSAEGDFDALAQLRAGRRSWTTQEGTVDVDGEGAGAEIDADARGTDGNDSVHITASFDC